MNESVRWDSCFLVEKCLNLHWRQALQRDMTKRRNDMGPLAVIVQLPQKGRSDILLKNLSGYIQIAPALPALKSIEPLLLFKDLCGLYQSNEAVDLPLCWYGLDQVTVLEDFYRVHISAG